MSRLARFWKGVSALIGAVTTTLVAFGVSLTPGQTAALVGLGTTLAVIFGPSNAVDTGDIAAVPRSQRLDHDGHPEDYADPRARP